MTGAHPEDEVLSASLDRDDPAVADHAAGCAACRERLDDLRRVASLVATPPAPLDEVAARRIVDAALAGARRRDDPGVYRRRRLVAVAAAVTVLTGGAVAIAALGGGNGPRRDVASDRSALAAGRTAGPVDGGDLGPEGDARALGERVRTALSGGAGTSKAARESASADQAGGPATPAAAPPAAATSARDGCVAGARRDFGSRLGPLAYQASLTWKGTAGWVLAFALPRTERDSPLAWHVLVMARSDCRLLIAISQRS